MWSNPDVVVVTWNADVLIGEALDKDIAEMQSHECEMGSLALAKLREVKTRK